MITSSNRVVRQYSRRNQFIGYMSDRVYHDEDLNIYSKNVTKSLTIPVVSSEAIHKKGQRIQCKKDKGTNDNLQYAV